jgi:predicted ATPase
MSITRLPLPGLVDRRREREALKRLVAGVQAGQSRVLVLRGEAGVGKSALLEHLAANAPGCQIARAAGVESEMELEGAAMQ